MKFHCLTLEDRLQFQASIAAIEQIAQYPLGNDFFQIEHGLNYFAFFDRLGDVHYYVALDGDRVAAVGAGILRQLSDSLAWYLCDLKVHPDYQRQYLSPRLLRSALGGNQQKCARLYAILMNPSRLASIYQRFPFLQFRHATTLNLYSLDAQTMDRFSSLVVAHRSTISYLSLQGIKDLRLASTGGIFPLLHVQWGATAGLGYSNPLPGYAHMFCTPENDELAIAIASQGISPIATATVISQGMDDWDWRFILTSEI
uniref:GNAT family N-acetyltransferase n=1 Tax=Desertifilum tharense IPPAS B-1220 TaxID=1781255 RepID=A0ACD5H5K8_9CYAN